MGEDIVVGRGDAIPEEMKEVGVDFPIYVCVPEDEVWRDSAISRVCVSSSHSLSPSLFLSFSLSISLTGL